MDNKFSKFLEIAEKVLGIVGTLASVIFAFSQSRILYFIYGMLVVLMIIGIMAIVKRKTQRLIIDGRLIEEAENLNFFASQKNLLNPIEAYHKCTIYKTKAIMEFEYKGICCARTGCGAMSFSMESSDTTDAENMDWNVYDLKNDPQKRRKLIPKVITPKGRTKRVKFKFIKRVSYNKTFHVISTQVTEYNARAENEDHYASVLTFKNRPIDKYKVILHFCDRMPRSVEVYKVKNNRGDYEERLDDYTVLDDGSCVYEDNIADGNAWSTRVYIWKYD